MSDKTEHTRGPWKIDIGHQTGRALGISAPTRNIVNFNGLAAPASSESHANALLIAAAPDMLEALELLVSDIKQGVDPCSKECRRITDSWGRALAAIARATGARNV